MCKRAGTDGLARGLAVLASCYVAIASAEPAGAAVSEYQWRLPPGFPPPAVPADNPMSAEKVALGCRLFFEPGLSVTGKYSCASCHHPERAFTDGRGQAVGATDAITPRGAMALANVAYNPAYTWASDSTLTLEQQMEQPLFNQHPVEMGLKRGDGVLASLLERDQHYADAFRAAFPGEAEPGTQQNMIKAIAAFERTLISGRSAFDRYVFDDDREALSPSAKRGMALFFSDRAACSVCHFGLNFAGSVAHRGVPKPTATFANNGSYDDEVGGDRGLAEATQRAQDVGRFRVPTLRNIGLTAPYMHDGSAKTLETVIDHYAAGPRRADPRIDRAIRRLDLTAEDKQALVDFLRSLTDESFVTRDYARCE